MLTSLLAIATPIPRISRTLGGESGSPDREFTRLREVTG
jgi:hypothetical protein